MNNIDLWLAVLQRDKKNYEVATEAKIHATNLSQLINNHYPQTIKQKQEIPNVLQRAMNELFKDRLKEVA